MGKIEIRAQTYNGNQLRAGGPLRILGVMMDFF